MFCNNKKHIPFFNAKYIPFLGFLFLFNLITINAQQDRISHQVIVEHLNPIEKWENLVTQLTKTERGDSIQFNYTDSLIKLAEELIPNKLAEAYLIVGEYHFDNDKLDKSIITLQEGLKHLTLSDEPQIKIQIYSPDFQKFL